MVGVKKIGGGEVALVRNLLIITFDESDTDAEKVKLEDLFISQGYTRISNLMLAGNVLKELIMQGAVQLGKFNEPNREQRRAKSVGTTTAKQRAHITRKDGEIHFDPARER